MGFFTWSNIAWIWALLLLTELYWVIKISSHFFVITTWFYAIIKTAYNCMLLTEVDKKWLSRCTAPGFTEWDHWDYFCLHCPREMIVSTNSVKSRVRSLSINWDTSQKRKKKKNFYMIILWKVRLFGEG